MDPELIITSDGSHSIRNPEVGDTYHSIHGAVQESRHVFIEAGLQPKVAGRSTLNVLEIGFGTGLNAYLTCLHQENVRIHYTALEAYPLAKTVYEQLNYPAQLKDDSDLLRKLHEVPWGEKVEITHVLQLEKHQTKLEEASLEEGCYDLVYYDAFGPDKQPEMWTPDVLRKVTQAIKTGGTLVTYCAKGQFKRDLKSLGLMVEVLPGPPGKFEMVRAHKQ